MMMRLLRTTIFIFVVLTVFSYSSVIVLVDAAPASYSGIESRIVGGNNAAKGEYPYYVKTDGCGAALISPSVILTAAHCGNRKGEEIIVGAYYSNDNKSVSQANAVRRTCVEYIVDPEFKYAGNNPNDPYPPMNNDFALCRLNKPVTTLEPIAINQNQNWPPLTTNNSPTLLTTIGLGTLQAGGSTPSQLQEVNVPIVSNQVCSNRYEPGDIYTPGNICAGAEQKDSCQGDSGGPIIYNINSKDYHIGTVSWGQGCGSKQFPGVYSRTSTRADWMKKTVCETFNDNDAELCGGGGNDPVPAPVIAPTATPVIKPTSPPDVGGGGCDGKGGKEFVIELTTDEYPQDTSYVVKDLGTKKNILVEKNFNTRYKLYKESICNKAETCFQFTIKDSFKNGLTEGSEGGYELFLDGTLVKKGRDFGKKDIYRYKDCIEGGGGGGDECKDKKGKFKVNGIRGRWTCRKVKKRKKCNKAGNDGQPLSKLCPVKCNTSCVDDDNNDVNIIKPTESPTSSPTPSPTPSPTESPTESPTDFPTVSESSNESSIFTSIESSDFTSIESSDFTSIDSSGFF